MPRCCAHLTPQTFRENPFFFLGLHLAIRQQVATDRPAGIARVHRLFFLAGMPTRPSTA